MLVNGEDCALTSSDKSAGRRGLCGTMLLFKILGAMAERGDRLERPAAGSSEGTDRTTEQGYNHKVTAFFCNYVDRKGVTKWACYYVRFACSSKTLKCDCRRFLW